MPSSESRRVVLIVAAFVVLGVGAALYYILVFQPGRDREAARGSIAEWEAKWEVARSCLLGKDPLSSDLAVAISARELLAGTTDAAMGDCTKAVGGLTRPPGPDSGVPAVEAAWPRLEQAGSKVAQSYALHRQRPLGDNPLPAALDELVKAHTALRAAAGMGPAKKIDAPETPALAPQPLMLAGAPVADIGGITVGGVLRGRANVTGKGPFDVTWNDQGLTGQASLRGGVRSVPDRKWELEVVIDDDDSSTLTAGANAVTVDTAKTPIVPLLAIGEGDARFAVYSIADRVVLARSADGGANWDAGLSPAVGEVAFTGNPAGDRLDLAWTTANGLALLTLTPATHAKGELPAATILPAQELATWCTGGAIWLVGATATGYTVFHNGTPPGVELKLSGPRPIACSADRLALRGSGDNASDQLCTPTGCTELPSAGGEERALGLVGDHVYRAGTRGRVVAVWRDADPVKFFHIPEPREIYGIADVGGKAVLLLLDEKQLALEQAPLP
jgi:hypothetical protein